MWNDTTKEELKKKREAARKGGGEAKIDRQHAKGKLTAAERIEILFDKGSFFEINRLVTPRKFSFEDKKDTYYGDGVITGCGTINGRTVFLSAEDFTVFGGSLGAAHSEKICHIMDLAMRAGAPYIALNDSGGARIDEGVCSLNGYSGIFLRNTKASGVIPQISVIMGPCAGGACYSPAISDFVFMVDRTSEMFITGPKVVESVTGEYTTTEFLGGSEIHSSKSGVAHFRYKDEQSCLCAVRKLLSYLPSNNTAKLPEEETVPQDDLVSFEEIVPDNPRQTYDIKKVILALADQDSFMEIQKDFAQNIVIGFLRLNGKTIGIVANQPKFLGGAIDCNASDKAARFVRFCDCFSIPLLTLVDVPGYLPGVQQEHGGIIRHGAKLLYAFSEASVPKVSLILRKAFGGAYIAMNSKSMGADFSFAWPIAQIAVMGAESAATILNNAAATADSYAVKQAAEEYTERYMNPYVAAEHGIIDDVIFPEETAEKIKQAFEFLKEKKADIPARKHGNIPL